MNLRAISRGEIDRTARRDVESGRYLRAINREAGWFALQEYWYKSGSNLRAVDRVQLWGNPQRKSWERVDCASVRSKQNTGTESIVRTVSR